MPYPRHLINEGETVALDLHPHWWYFSKHILTGIPLFLALIGVLTLSGSVQTVAAWAWAILAIIWAGWLAIDRKSTRLNSSHQIISYAVFCLKKKKKQQPL